MSDKPISVNDVVMVVRGLECCGSHTDINGMIGAVTRVVPSSGGACNKCNAPWYGLSYDTTIPGGPIDGYRVVRIDPPAHPETVTQGEEIHA